MKNLEQDCETSGFCGGFRHCHEYQKTYSKDDPQCIECAKDA